MFADSKLKCTYEVHLFNVPKNKHKIKCRCRQLQQDFDYLKADNITVRVTLKIHGHKVDFGGVN